eukprot:1144884-Pelagomonas_calceolata.AAC.2
MHAPTCAVALSPEGLDLKCTSNTSTHLCRSVKSMRAWTSGCGSPSSLPGLPPDRSLVFFSGSGKFRLRSTDALNGGNSNQMGWRQVAPECRSAICVCVRACVCMCICVCARACPCVQMYVCVCAQPHARKILNKLPWAACSRVSGPESAALKCKEVAT